MRRILRMATMGILLVGVLASALSTPAAGVPQIRLSVATGVPGSATFLIAGALARLISQKIPNVEATVVNPTGPEPRDIANLRLLAARQADLVFGPGAQAWDALRGDGPFKDTTTLLRVLVPLFSNFFHVVTVEGTGISTMEDLRGKRVSLGGGEPGQAPGIRRILLAVGVNPDQDIRQPDFGRRAAIVAALREKKLDAILLFGFVPTAEIFDLAMTPGTRIKLIPVDSLLPALPKPFGSVFSKVTIPKELYPGLAADVPTFGSFFVLSARPDLSPGLTYQITRLVYESRAELAQAHPQAQYITLIGVAARSPIPFHPGVARYFSERGVGGF